MSFIDLFQPKWKHSKSKIRKKAVNKISDQALLAKIAKSPKFYDDYYDPETQRLAVERLTDQNLLADVAKKASIEKICYFAVLKVTDQSLLTDIAKNSTYQK